MIVISFGHYRNLVPKSHGAQAHSTACERAGRVRHYLELILKPAAEFFNSRVAYPKTAYDLESIKLKVFCPHSVEVRVREGINGIHKHKKELSGTNVYKRFSVYCYEAQERDWKPTGKVCDHQHSHSFGHSRFNAVTAVPSAGKSKTAVHSTITEQHEEKR